MTLLPPAFPDSLRTDGDPDLWPAVLAHRDEVRQRIEAAIALQDPAVRDVLVAPLLRDAEGAAWARSALWGLALAGVAGCRAVAPVDEFAFRMQGPRGSFVLAPMAFRTRSGAAGEPEHVDALVRVLEQALHEHRYVLHVKKPLPSGFDPEPIGQAVQLWLLALRQGTWSARYVAYEDGDLCIEIGLVDLDRRPRGRGLVSLVGPHRSLERMAEVDARVVDLTAALAPRLGDDPLVPVLTAQPRWSLSRGYVAQLLYGTPRETCAERGGIHVTYEPNGLSLFSDPGSRRIAALWWAEPDGGSLGVRGWAHDNPWCRRRAQVPAFPGLRFTTSPGDPEAGDPTAPATLTWTGPSPSTWSPAT